MITSFYILGIIGFTVWIVVNLLRAFAIIITTFKEFADKADGK